MQDRVRYHCPCPHEAGLAPEGVPASDYHPLTIEEIASLLATAAQSDISTASSIQIRLEQGVVGAICPIESGSRIARKQSLLAEIFIDNYRRGADPALVEHLYHIMHYDD